MTAAATHVKPKILCIDDDPAITAALALRLREFDVEVVTASDGTDGLWRALNEQPDVIVTDLRMPHGDGDYLVECLKGRADTAEIPVIALTGKRDGELKRWMNLLGVEHYLLKPLRFQRIVAALEQYIDLKPLATSS